MFSILTRIYKNSTSIKDSFILLVYILWDHPYITSLYLVCHQTHTPQYLAHFHLPYNYNIVKVLPCSSTKLLLFIGTISPYAFFNLALKYGFGELFVL